MTQTTRFVLRRRAAAPGPGAVGRDGASPDRRYRAVQRQGSHRRQGFLDPGGARHRPRPRARTGTSQEMRKLAGEQRAPDRSRRPNRDPGADRWPYSRRSRRGDLRHRGQLDRRSHPQAGTGKNSSGGADPEAGFMDHRRRRLDRGAVRGEAAAERRRRSCRPRRTIRSTSSICTTGCCCRRRRWRS